MIDWTDAFDNSGYVAGSELLAERWSKEALAFRAAALEAGLADVDLAYGSGERNRLDLFVPEGVSRGLIVFVHGGYWHMLDKSYWSHLANGPRAAGWVVAIPSYPLAPDVRIAEITRCVRDAVVFGASRVAGPIRLIGHSAGGHLVTRMACADVEVPAEVMARVEKIVSVSGIHDLRPLRLAAMNETLRLTEAEAAAESPALHAPPGDLAISFWVGAQERPELLRQTRLIAEAWQRQDARVSDHYEAGKNHFSVIEALGAADSALVDHLTS